MSKLKSLKEFISSSITEARMKDVVDHPVGSIVHPYSHGSGWGMGVRHGAPHEITRKLTSKTELTNKNTGEKFSVSHANGTVKDAEGNEKKYGFDGFHTPEEKKIQDDRISAQREKDVAHDSIVKHLSGLKNGMGHTVGTLSDEDHAMLLNHLEKLREKK